MPTQKMDEIEKASCRLFKRLEFSAGNYLLRFKPD